MEEISTVCCACLCETTSENEIVQLSLIYDEKHGLTYRDCLKICTNIEFLAEENILCKVCSEELEISYSFLRKVIKSQSILNDVKEDRYFAEFIEHREEQDENIIEEIIGEEDEEWINVTEQHQLDTVEQEAENEQQDITLIVEETHSPTENFEIESKEDIVEEHENMVNKTETIQYRRNTETDGTKENTYDEIIEEVAFEETGDFNDTNSNFSWEPNIITDNGTPTLNKGKNLRTRYFGKFHCEHCGKLFPNHSRMLIHRRTHEKFQSIYTCKLCGRMYASDQALSVHIRTAHNGDGLTCPVCSKVFSVQRSLDIHMRYHSQDFPFDCGDCGKKFAQKSHLNSHKNMHNGLRFICIQPNCGKLFTSSPALREHEFTHNVMPFECNLCHGGYPSKSKLKTHLRKVHAMELTLDELEPMRKFHTMRSKPNVVKLDENTT